jgi:hypothetical protein
MSETGKTFLLLLKTFAPHTPETLARVRPKVIK